MDDLNAITMLYLLKNWDEQASLLDCAHKFQQTKAELEAALKDEKSNAFAEALGSGKWSM